MIAQEAKFELVKYSLQGRITEYLVKLYDADGHIELYHITDYYNKDISEITGTKIWRLQAQVNIVNENLIENKLVQSCHDVSLGGILTAVAKMCIKGQKGIKIHSFKELVNKFEYFFGEDQGRYIIEIESSNVNKVNDLLKKNSVHFDDLGVIEDKNLSFNGEMNLPIEELTKTHKYWLKNYMEN